MADLIDRQALLEQFRRKKCYESCGLFDICRVPCSVAKIILDAPAVEPKRGEWINDNDPMYPYSCHCSECGETALTKEETSYDYVLSSYCPNCGARMRGEEE